MFYLYIFKFVAKWLPWQPRTKLTQVHIAYNVYSLLKAYDASLIHWTSQNTSYVPNLNIGSIEMAAILENGCHGNQGQNWLWPNIQIVSTNVPSLVLLSQSAQQVIYAAGLFVVFTDIQQRVPKMLEMKSSKSSIF